MDVVSDRAQRWKPIEVNDRPIVALAFSADGRSLAAAGGGLIPGATAIRVIDVETRTIRRRCHGHVMGVFAVAFDARTGLLASASHDYSVLLWEVDDRNDAIYLVGDQSAGISRSHVAFRATSIVIGDGMTFQGEHASVHTIDLETGARDVVLTLDEDSRLGIDELALLPDGEMIVVAVDDMRDSSGHQQVRLIGPRGMPRTRWNPGGRLHGMNGLARDRLIAMVGPEDDAEDVDQELVVFSAMSGTRLASRRVPGTRFPTMTVSPDHQTVLVGDAKRLMAFDAATLEPAFDIDLRDDSALSIAWSVSDVIAVGTFRTVRLFTAATRTERLD